MKINKSLLESALKHLDKTEKFILAQAPDIIRELFLEGMIEITISLAGSTIYIIAGLWSLLTFNSILLLGIENFTQAANLAIHLIAILLGTCGTLEITYDLTKIAKIILTPKLYLMRKIKEMITNLVSSKQ